MSSETRPSSVRRETLVSQGARNAPTAARSHGMTTMGPRNARGPIALPQTKDPNQQAPGLSQAGPSVRTGVPVRNARSRESQEVRPSRCRSGWHRRRDEGRRRLSEGCGAAVTARLGRGSPSGAEGAVRAYATAPGGPAGASAGVGERRLVPTLSHKGRCNALLSEVGLVHGHTAILGLGRYRLLARILWALLSSPCPGRRVPRRPLPLASPQRGREGMAGRPRRAAARVHRG